MGQLRCNLGKLSGVVSDENCRAALKVDVGQPEKLPLLTK